MPANRLVASGSVRLQRYGFLGYAATRKWYRTRTITATYESHVTGFHPGEYTDRNGSITLVYEMTLSGEIRLTAASGTWNYEDLDKIPQYHPENPDVIVGYQETLTTQSAGVNYNPAGGSGLGSFSWTGAASSNVPGNFGTIPSTPPSTVAGTGDEREWTATIVGGTWKTKELLEIEYTDDMLKGHAQELIAAIDLDGVSLDGSGLTARFGGVGPYRTLAQFDAAIELAEEQVSISESDYEAAQAEVVIARSALSAAESAVATAREEVRPAFLAAMAKRDALESVQIRIETWRRRKNAAELAAAEGDRPSAITEWESAKAAWDEKVHALDVAIDAVRLSRGMLANAEFIRLQLLRFWENAKHHVELAKNNKTKGSDWDQILVEAGGVGGDPRWEETYDSEGALSAVTLVKERFQFYWLHPSSWSKPPRALAVHWRLATISPTQVQHTALSAENLSLARDAVIGLGEVHAVPVPSQESLVVVAGLPSRGTILWQPEWRGGAARKMGFLAYDGTPRYFLQETASGGFQGCPAQSLPAKNYGGSQVYSPAPDILANWQSTQPGAVVQTFSADVPEHRRSIVPSPEPYRTGVGTPAHEEFLERGEVLSGTQRRWLANVRCGNNMLEDLQALTLSREFSTASLRNLVDPVAEQSFEQLPQLVAPEYYSVISNYAVRWMSPNQDYYVRIVLRGVFVWIPPAGFSGHFGVPPTLSMQWRATEIDLQTGERISTNQPVTLNDGISQVLTLNPPEGKAIEVGPAQLSSDHPTMWDIPMWTPVCEDN